MHTLEHSQPTVISTQTVHVLMMSSFAIRVHDVDNDMPETSMGIGTFLKSTCDICGDAAAIQ